MANTKTPLHLLKLSHVGRITLLPHFTEGKLRPMPTGLGKAKRDPTLTLVPEMGYTPFLLPPASPGHLLFGKHHAQRQGPDLETTQTASWGLVWPGQQRTINYWDHAEAGRGPSARCLHRTHLFGASKSVSDVNGTASFFCRGGIPGGVRRRRRRRRPLDSD